MGKGIENLLSEMTLEEKVGLLAGTDFWHTHPIERIGIPALKVTDGPCGARTMADDDPNRTLPATAFPTGVAMAATWNTTLIQRVGEAIGEEARERGCAVLLGPCVNIHRSPLGGRNFESFSEDPFLSSRMAVAYIKGVQSRKVGACVKHFALNNSEYQRFTISSEAAERTMREIYFPSFERPVKEAGTWAVMCSYNKVNGIYASENRHLLSEILKDEWGFEGAVISDWFATHSTVPAALAGLDLEMPGPPCYFGEALISAVREGKVRREALDDKVRRILRVIDASGDINRERKMAAGSSLVGRHWRLARRVAEEAIVLLKNDHNILPLKMAKLKSITVTGPNAAEARIEGGGSSMVVPYYRVSPLEGLKRYCEGRVRIRYEPGCLNHYLTPPLDSKYLFPDGEKWSHGLTGEYFNNHERAGRPVLIRIDKNFVCRWLTGTSPGHKIDADKFSIRWSGVFLAPESGRYLFGLLTNGRARLYLDGNVVVDHQGNSSKDEFIPGEEEVGEFMMEKGKYYHIQIEYWMQPSRRAPTRNIRIGCELPVPADLMERAVEIATHSDAALVFAGLSEEYESEGFDRENMDLPADQIELIKAVSRVNRNTVVVLNSGSPISMKSWIENVAGVVETWFPGQEGGNAIAAVLFGGVNPSGKLPDTFPERIEDTPAFLYYPGQEGKVLYNEGIFIGYRHYNKKGIEPLFPFGHGLSYTNFEYRNLRIHPVEIKRNGKLTVSIDITNSGKRKGQEVVQLYIRDKESSLERPPKELKGFQKIELRAGETKTASFILDQEALSFYHPEVKRWIAEPGEFEILIGSSSQDIRATAKLILKEEGSK